MTTDWGAWRLVAVAALAGAIGAFAQAPYDMPLLMLVALIAASYLFSQAKTTGRAALIGWAFGFGYFLHALQWIVSPFMVDVARHGWMAPFALVFMGAGMALFWGVAFWGARRLSSRHWPLILCFAAAELTRAYILTGFPWAMPAQATVGVIIGQGMALVGPYALNMILIAAALAIAASGPMLARAALAIGTGLLLILPALAPPASLSDHTLRLIQPNATQRDKWNPDLVPVFFQRQLDFTAAAGTPDLTIWPETAIPWRMDMAGGAFEKIAQAAQDRPVILGVQRSEDLRHFNTLAVLGAGGQVMQTYDKHHLVPFGEYMPLGDLAVRFGIAGLAAQNGNGYSAGPGAELLDLGPLGSALPLICYEAVFAHDVNAAPARPNFLIQITNDGWFGKGAGPMQHLAQARMRAIEQGLPLARSANTGVSAMIDPYGRITAALALNTAGYLDAPLPAPLAPTLYSRTGDLPLAVILLLGLICTIFTSRRTLVD